MTYKVGSGHYRQLWLCTSKANIVGVFPTNLTKIHSILAERVKTYYPVNQVPDHVIDELNALREILMDAETAIQEVVDVITQDVADRENNRGDYAPKSGDG